MDYSSTSTGSRILDYNAYTYDDDGDDIFGLKKAKSDEVPGLFVLPGSFVSPPKKSDWIDDLLGGFGVGADWNSKSPKQNEAGFDDLVPGFGASSSPRDESFFWLNNFFWIV